MEERDTRHTAYLLFTLVLSVVGLAVIGASVALPMGPDTRRILDYADDVICGIFFLDFLVTLRRAPNRWQYFIRWGWIDLISSIPTIDAFRAGRAARIFRLLRVLRAMRSAKVIASFILQRRAHGAMLAATLMALLLIVLASIGILHFEDVPNANIKTAEDALWWTMTTITTVGYGDRYPVTSEGRVLAAGLMVAGVGLAGIYTGYVAAWFLRPLDGASETPETRIETTAKALVAMDVEELKSLAERMDRLRDLPHR
ncbi:MAG: ion transporter [Dokdonella sp.]|uniref:ion transporter n=1 Tax=Dokdonella sp. TaxID=2291710 RepID=UPI0032672CA6